ncbi:hypothetical protein ABE530_17500 [Brucella sp. TWI559]
MQTKINKSRRTNNTQRTLKRMKKQPRIHLTVERDCATHTHLIDRATLHLTELIAQQIARDVFRDNSPKDDTKNPSQKGI